MRSDVDLFVDACVRGARGNMAAAYLGAFEAFDGRTRDAVCGRVRAMGEACPRVESADGDGGRGSFVWLDGSRRARLAV